MLISTVQQSDYYTYTYTYTHTYIYTHTYTHICSYYFPLWFNHRILNIVFCAISRTLLVIRPVYNSLCKPMFGECFRTAPTGFIPPVFLPSLMTSYGWICAWSPMVSFVNLLSHLCSLFQKSWLHLCSLHACILSWASTASYQCLVHPFQKRIIFTGKKQINKNLFHTFPLNFTTGPKH